MLRTHNLSNPNAPFCWLCGESYIYQSNWVQCQGCGAWECSNCALTLVAFEILYCESCDKEYCNTCSKPKEQCPDCKKAGEHIYGYSEYYETKRGYRIKGQWLEPDCVPSEFAMRLSPLAT